MKKFFLYFILLASISTVTLQGCGGKSHHHKSKKGRQQPKKGPMPCPMKDC